MGEHTLLGSTQIKLADVDELLIGDLATNTTTNQPYGNWSLHDAPEPLLAGSTPGATRDPGTVSALVGTEAPDFTLDLLEGGRFCVKE